MPSTTPSHRRGAAFVGVVVAGLAFGAAAPASASALPHMAGLCVTLDNLTEQTVQVSNLTGTPGHVGAGADYSDIVRDAAGAQVGTATGHVQIIAENPANGHLIASYKEQGEIEGGSFTSGGVIDRTAADEGQWVGYPAVGTGGDLSGRVGVRVWKIISPATATVALKMVLCG